MKTRFILIFAILFTLFQKGAGQAVGDPAPGFSVDLLGGGNFSLDAQEGKVVLIFFFGNGCPFCITSGPSVEELYNSYKADPDFVAVGLDTWNSSSSETSVEGFKNASGVTFPLALLAGSVSTSYGITYDRLVVIDRDGKIRHKGTTAAVNDAAGANTAIAAALADEGMVMTSLENHDPEEFGVYPLPANEVLYFTTNGQNASTANLQIYDISGKIQMNTDLALSSDEGTFSADVSKLKAGVYFYKFKRQGEEQKGKILIQ